MKDLCTPSRRRKKKKPRKRSTEEKKGEDLEVTSEMERSSVK